MPQWNMHLLRAWPFCKEKSSLQSKLELSTCERILCRWRKVTPQRTNCADCVIRRETLIDYIHAHIRALIKFRQSQVSADKATNRPSWEPKIVTVTTELHHRQAAAGCWESWHRHTLDKNWSFIGSVGNWIPCKHNQTSRRYQSVLFEVSIGIPRM